MDSRRCVSFVHQKDSTSRMRELAVKSELDIVSSITRSVRKGDWDLTSIVSRYPLKKHRNRQNWDSPNIGRASRRFKLNETQKWLTIDLKKKEGSLVSRNVDGY